MVNQPTFDLKQLIDIWKSNISIWPSVQCKQIKLYDIGAWDFQHFAKQDLEDVSTRGQVNALCNAKRAIECRVDELLKLFNIKCFSERLPLRVKIEGLQKFGVPAPRMLLSQMTSKRNLLEHEYVMPAHKKEAESIVELAELYLSATDKYVQKGYILSANITHITTEGVKDVPNVDIWDDFREDLWEDQNKMMERRIDKAEEYELIFDLDNETLKVTRRQLNIQSNRRKKTRRIRSNTEIIGQPSVTTIAIRDCKIEDVRELMKMLFAYV